MEYPKISIVTPSYNQSAYLEETIQSVVFQNYPNLEYIIIDGGSTDGSVEIIKKYEKYLSYWVCEPDKGLYNALQKGFLKSTGDIMGWINSDDLLHRKSLFVLANIFHNNPQVNWLQGRPTLYDETGMTVDSQKPVFSKYHFYLKKYKTGQFIQQESTYWRRSLWQRAGSCISEKYKYAGDFELWMRFFQHEQLFITHALIGGYRVRGSQLSRDFYKEYLEECSSIIDALTLTEEEVNQVKKIRFFESKLMKVRGLNSIIKARVQNLYGASSSITFDFSTGKFS